MNHVEPRRVAIVGGGLAGLAAAVALADRQLQIELFESRSRLGGRAASFRDAQTGDAFDHCQHVSLGCCTNLADFCRRTGLDELLRRDRTLYFFGPDGRRFDFCASSWLPAPLHLAPALWSLKYLSRTERLSIGFAMLRLARLSRAECQPATIGTWLRSHGQSESAIARFWTPVLISALSETVDRASLWYARKVFVDGFMATRHGYEMLVPRVPLDELYGRRLLDWLAEHGIDVRLSTAVKSITWQPDRLELQYHEERKPFDAAICAVPWRQVSRLLERELQVDLPTFSSLSSIEAVPITAIHLWFDRPITDLPHAVLIDRVGQWLFRREMPPAPGSADAAHYYQVVISASRNEVNSDRAALVRHVHQELACIWPEAAAAELLHWRVVSEPEAVFSVVPEIDSLRPGTLVGPSNLLLAGDWTATGWPATMEGAVRSGYRAAEAVLDLFQAPARLLLPDVSPEWLARRLIRGD